MSLEYKNSIHIFCAQIATQIVQVFDGGREHDRIVVFVQNFHLMFEIKLTLAGRLWLMLFSRRSWISILRFLTVCVEIIRLRRNHMCWHGKSYEYTLFAHGPLQILPARYAMLRRGRTTALLRDLLRKTNHATSQHRLTESIIGVATMQLIVKIASARLLMSRQNFTAHRIKGGRVDLL